jgi:hypothetical protein
VRAPGGCSGKCPSDLAATRTRRRGRVAGVIAHGVAVAWVWRGWAKARQQHGSGSSWGCAHTRAVPGWPGPRRGRAVRGAPAPRARGTTAAAEGDGVRGSEQRRDGLLQEKWHGGRRGAGVPKAPTEGSSARPAAAGKGKRAAAVVLTGGLRKRGLGAAERRGRWVDAVQGEQQRRRGRSGRRLGEAPVRRRCPPPRAAPGGGVLRAPLLLLLLSLHFSSGATADWGKWRRCLGFRGGGRGLLMGRS